MAIRVLLAEDMHMVRGALVALLGMEPDLDIVAEAASGDEALSKALEYEPDVAVLDIAMPGGDGLKTAEELSVALPSCRVVILTAMARPGVLRRAITAHVAGFVAKDAPPAQLAQAIRQVAAGEHVIDPKLAAAALRMPPSPLTDREIEVLRLFDEGADTRAIAGSLHLAQGTVRNHLASIVMKLNAKSKVDAARIARAADWI